MNDSLGNRIKHNYEDAYRIKLPYKMPLILRLDGKSFHSVTAKCTRPFDLKLIDALNETAIYLCSNIQGAKIGYTQSDELSILVYNPSFEAQAWFDNNLQKMVSISAGMASSYFTSISHKVFGETKITQFDSRAFIAPLDEVTNVFEFRQQDAVRNSIQMVSQSLFSPKELNGKNLTHLKEMILTKTGKSWGDLPISQQRGRCIIKQKYMKENVERSKWIIDENIPIFSQDRNYIDQYVYPMDSAE